MAKARRLYALGDGFYHLIIRTVGGEAILDSSEKGILIAMITGTADFGGIQVLTCCIMDNHVHLIVCVPMRTPVSGEELERRLRSLYGKKKAGILFSKWRAMEEEGHADEVDEEKERYIERMYNLSDFVKTWKEDFTQSYNRRHDKHHNLLGEDDRRKKRIGTVWSGRFKSILLNNKPHLTLIVSLYVDLNPVRAHMKGVGRDAGNYTWSGIGAALKGDPGAMNGILALGRRAGFADGETTAEEAVARYHRMLLGKAEGREREFLNRSFRVGENDERFDKSLRGKSMTLFDLLFCKCRCFEDGRALGGNPDEFRNFSGSHPRRSVIPDCYSANGLRETVVIVY